MKTASITRALLIVLAASIQITVFADEGNPNRATDKAARQSKSKKRPQTLEDVAIELRESPTVTTITGEWQSTEIFPIAESSLESRVLLLPWLRRSTTRHDAYFRITGRDGVAIARVVLQQRNNRAPHWVMESVTHEVAYLDGFATPNRTDLDRDLDDQFVAWVLDPDQPPALTLIENVDTTPTLQRGHIRSISAMQPRVPLALPITTTTTDGAPVVHTRTYRLTQQGDRRVWVTARFALEEDATTWTLTNIEQLPTTPEGDLRFRAYPPHVPHMIYPRR